MIEKATYKKLYTSLEQKKMKDEGEGERRKKKNMTIIFKKIYTSIIFTNLTHTMRHIIRGSFFFHNLSNIYFASF